MQGAWDHRARSHNGTEGRLPDGQDVSEFEGRVQTFRHNGEAYVRWTLELDPSRSPKWVTLTRGGETLLGVYKIEGDTQTISVDETGKRRSDGFEGGQGLSVCVLQRRRR